MCNSLTGEWDVAIKAYMSIYQQSEAHKQKRRLWIVLFGSENAGSLEEGKD